jgi:prepilin peptidase CpaA
MLFLFPGLLTCLMLAVVYYDLTRYLIPNWLVGLILILYPAMWFTATHAGVDVKMSVAAMAMVFAGGYIVFMLRLMGGGDIKLATVCSLWVGLPMLLDFLLWVAVGGGVLSLVLLMVRPVAPQWLAKFSKSTKIPRVLTMGEPVPYGLAIAAAFFYLMWAGKIPALPLR